MTIERKRWPSAEWLAWSIEVAELREQKARVCAHPHRLGPKWVEGQRQHYDRRINHLLANEPPKYQERH